MSARAWAASAGGIAVCTAALVVPAVAQAHSAELPPECIPVAIASASGAGPVYHFRFCGAGAGGDSPLADWVSTDRQPLLVDGSALRMAGCGTTANPCVIIRQG